MMGGTVGSLAHRFLPGYTADPGAYALIGMGTAFAGIVRTPLTSVIMIFEMTRDYTIIVPLMISNLIAFFISQRLQPEPIYEALARQDGVHLPTAESRSQRGKTRVAQIMRSAPIVLNPQSDVASAMDRVKMAQFDAWPVADNEGLWGMIEHSDLEKAASNGRSEGRLSDIVYAPAHGHRTNTKELPHVHPDHTLSLVLERMGKTGLHVLPVVSRANVRELMGIVVLNDVLDAYGVRKPSVAREYEE